MSERENNEIKKIIRDVADFVEKEGHSYITPEHLTYVLMDEGKVVSYCERNRVNRDMIKASLVPLLATIEKENCASKVVPSSSYLRILSRANSIAGLRASSPNSIYVILAILEETDDCYSRFLLLKNGFTDQKLKEFMKGGSDEDSLLRTYSTELVSAARAGKIDALVGRDSEIESLIRILNRRKNSCPLLVGAQGVGKTAIVEGFALKIARGDVPDSCKDRLVYSIDLGAMISGTKFRGEFEDRLTKVIKELSDDKNAIGFIDEIHTIVGAGSGSDSSLDASNILKPYLSNGSLRLIGSTTYDEYKNHILKDKAFSRRFKKIDISEPSADDTLKIIRGLCKSYESFHGIKYSDEILKSIVDLSNKYVHDRNFPDKAIDVLDEIGSKYRSKLYSGKRATIDDVEEVICKMANIPSIVTHDNEKERLLTLAERIKGSLFGQDDIVDAIYQKVKLAKAGFRDVNRPLITGALIGSSGCGKTEFAKLLALNLGIGFVHLDMSEYKEEYAVSRLIGSAAGYVGYEQSGALTEPLLRTPHCVVLLDEIEKAHSAVFDLLLQVLDEGRLTDNHGRVASFKNAIVLMTSNVGCAIADKKSRALGFGVSECVESCSRRETIEKSMKDRFAPEFRNRLQGIYYFNDLSVENFDMIVEKNLNALRAVLTASGVTLSVSKDVVRHLAVLSKEENLGGRPVSRNVEKEISEKVVDKILFDKVKHIDVTMSGGVIDFQFS